MDVQGVRAVYRRYARHYDRYFGKVFHQGRKLAIDQMGILPGQHVLEVGVGTGLSLPEYPQGVRVTGIDLSPEMIEGAQARVDALGLADVALHEMDASAMDFPDASFDHVVAMYVLSVAPEPERVIAEMRRVCKPGGRLYIVNHFRHANLLISGLERAMAPLSQLLGFRPDFALDEFIARNDLDVIEALPVNLFGYWTLLTAAREPADDVMASADVRPAGSH
ncbi:MAG: methyltransferase domain-containing protein [Gammaproteobacteria bacterium]|nr:methyltransferase domain-containing protein [Gammaproteobacteria bacterium]